MPDQHDRHGRPRQVYHAAPQAGPAQGGASPKNMDKNGQKSPKNSPKNGKDFWRRNQRGILVGGGILLLVVVLLLVMLLPSCSGDDAAPDASDATSLPSLTGDEVQGTTMTEREVPLPVEQYEGTILAESEDAGQQYVDDTLFLGDSNTVRMLSYRDVTGVSPQNAIGVVGMGIQSVTSYKCVKYAGYGSLVTMPEAVAITQPRRVVITFGTNNVGGMGVDNFITYYEGAIEAIRSSYDYADIILGAVFPVDANCSASGITLDKIDRYNAALAELAERMDCKFLYWSEALEDTSGYAVSNYTISDGYHISRDGMEALFNYFRTHAYITEDNRPPLTAVPERLDADVGLITSDGNTTTVAGQDVSMPQIAEPIVDDEEDEEEPEGELAAVHYTVWDETNAVSGGGTVTVGGGSHTSYTFECYVGEGAPGASATAAEGYRFSHWSTNADVDTGSANIGGFTVNSASITLTAVFVQEDTGLEASTSLPDESEPGDESSSEPDEGSGGEDTIDNGDNDGNDASEPPPPEDTPGDANDEAGGEDAGGDEDDGRMPGRPGFAEAQAPARAKDSLWTA